MYNRSQGMRSSGCGQNCAQTCTQNNNRTSRSSERIVQKINWMDLPLAMGYVPCQKYGELFDLCKGFHLGTIFPDLCKPFCGKGGRCR